MYSSAVYSISHVCPAQRRRRRDRSAAISSPKASTASGAPGRIATHADWPCSPPGPRRRTGPRPASGRGGSSPRRWPRPGAAPPRSPGIVLPLDPVEGGEGHDSVVVPARRRPRLEVGIDDVDLGEAFELRVCEGGERWAELDARQAEAPFRQRNRRLARAASDLEDARAGARPAISTRSSKSSSGYVGRTRSYSSGTWSNVARRSRWSTMDVYPPGDEEAPRCAARGARPCRVALAGAGARPRRPRSRA